MNYIDIDGNIEKLEIEGDSIIIDNNPRIQTITKASPKLKSITIINNPNLETIIFNLRFIPILKIINNPKLAELNNFGLITLYVEIHDNPLLNEMQIKEDIEKNEIVYPKIVIYRNSNIPITICDDNISNYEFNDNIPDLQNSPDYLCNENKYMIHYEIYRGKSYPIVVIPKGTILYTYTKLGKKYNKKDVIENIYNTDMYETYDKELKFFYTVPYGGKTVLKSENYNACIATVLTDDTRVMCMVKPAPQNMENMFDPLLYSAKNSTGEIYYTGETTFPCEYMSHDLCLETNMMREMQLQGYMNIDINDSISNGKPWLENMNIRYSYIKDYIMGSCLSSFMIEKNNSDIINDAFKINTPKNTIFGLPQIVLCPIKSENFGNTNLYQNIYNNLYKNKLTEIQENNYVHQYFNYMKIVVCSLIDLENQMSYFIEHMVRNNQYQLFFLHKQYKNSDYTNISDINSKITLDDIDYLTDYNEGNPGCAFETIGYKMLKDGVKGGNKRKTLRNNARRKTTQRYKNRLTVLPQKNMKMCFKKVGPIPIMYYIENTM